MSILRRSVLGLLAPAVLLLAQNTNLEIRNAETRWVTAVSKADIAAADMLMADDLVYTHSTGSIDNKTEYLAKLKSGVQKYASMQYSDQKIRVFGNTAVVNGTIRMTGSNKGVPFDNTLLVTHVWVKQGNSWKLVSHQTTVKAAS